MYFTPLWSSKFEKNSDDKRCVALQVKTSDIIYPPPTEIVLAYELHKLTIEMKLSWNHICILFNLKNNFYAAVVGWAYQIQFKNLRFLAKWLIITILVFLAALSIVVISENTATLGEKVWTKWA